MDLDVTPEGTDDPLMRGLGDRVHMFVWHNDEVRPGHPMMRVLAASTDCPNHVWRYGDAPIWGVQGHPELKAVEAVTLFERHRERLVDDGADPDDLVSDVVDSEGATRLVDNFIDIVVNGTRAKPASAGSTGTSD